MTYPLKEELQKRLVQVDAALEGLLLPEERYPGSIHQAMRYSVFAGGKRLRPALVLAACEAVGGEPAQVLTVACALEMIHTYSLVHDDLPAMDDDDYRRGRLTNHKVYGEATAVLAGDALLTQAFELMARGGREAGRQSLEGALRYLQVMEEVALASGTLGMIGGQVVDMESEGKGIDGDTLEYIHTHKTGALFRASVRSGGILGGADAKQLAALTEYAEALGLAFQITDDLLDIEGDADKIGKPVGSDIKNHKVTYPSLYGLEEARTLAREAVDKAEASLRDFGEGAQLLREIARYLLKRES